MKFFRFTALSVLFVLLAGSARAASAWAQLKLGMTAEQAVAIVGEPLQRSAGQGFEIWTYDDRAELLFYGPLVGWSAPRSADMVTRSVDVWSAPAAATAQPQILPRPVATMKSGAALNAVTSSSLPRYRRRS